jgi:hypothetical protein
MIIVSVDAAAAAVVERYTYVRPDGSRRIFSDPFLDGGGNKLGGLARRRYAAVHVGIARRFRRASLLVKIGPEGWTPTQQPPEFSPSLFFLPRDLCFYPHRKRKR